MTTRLRGPDTLFLPFNRAPAARARTAGRATRSTRTATGPPTCGSRCGSATRGCDPGRVRARREARARPVLFPRFHQWHAVQQLLDATTVDRPGHEQAGPALRRVGQVEHHRVAGARPVPAAHPGLTRRADRGAQRRRARGRPAGVRQGRRHHRPKVLDRQLQETVAGFEHTPGIDREDRPGLRSSCKAALEGTAARIIITTLQKFPVVAETRPSESRRAPAPVRGDRGRGALDRERGGGQGPEAGLGDLRATEAGAVERRDATSDRRLLPMRRRAAGSRTCRSSRSPPPRSRRRWSCSAS